MSEEAGAARALFERFVKARAANPTLGFEEWLEGHADLADSLRSLYQQQSTELFHPPRERPAEGASYSAGDRVGDFRLIEFLGAGGMGEVWKAEQTSVRRLVALKLVRRDKILSKRALQRFEREAQAGARIDHPNIASVYTVGHSSERPYIAQQLVENGSSLNTFISSMRGQELPSDYFPKVARLFAKVLDALQAAHDAGVIHRDLKPQNILVTRQGEPVIVDFGLARIEDVEPVSQTGDLVGTYCYMSPEQTMRSRIGVDHRTDVFSAGATFYELLTLHRAFDGETTHEVAEKILFSDPPEPRTIQSRVPRDLAVPCTKALEKRRQDRYQTAGEFAADLRRYLADEPILARPTTALERGIKWVRRHPAVSAFSCVGLGLALAAIWLGKSLSSSVAARTDAERNTLYERAKSALELNDLDGAIAFVAEAQTLDPHDPTGHLILASGFARFGRRTEMDRELRAAADNGFRMNGQDLETGIDHLAYALHLMSAGDLALYRQAEEHLRKALELDRLLPSSHYLLFQLHLVLGHEDLAREDLAAFQGRLGTGNPFWTVAEALGAELEGDPARACALLEELARRSDMDERRRTDLRLDVHLGRNYLLLGDLDRAEQHLLRAVSSTGDCEGRGDLAVLSFERYRSDEDDAERLDELQERAAEAIACGWLLRAPRALAAWAAVERFGKQEPVGDPRANPYWAAARESLADLERWNPDDPDLHRLRGRLAFLEAMFPLAEGDYRAAADGLSSALQHDPDALRARAMRGQCLWFLGEHELGLQELERALGQWDGAAERPWKAKWLGAILAWAYGHAVALGDAAAADRLRERIRIALEAPGAFEKEELLSLAEFLASEGRPELRKCELALELVERFGLRSAFRGTPAADAAAGVLATIDRACP